MLMEEGICVLSLRGSTVHHRWYNSHFKSVVQGAFFCVCSKVQLYIDLEKTALGQRTIKYCPVLSALCFLRPIKVHGL